MFRRDMNPKCYLTPGNITTLASATAERLIRACTFHPQGERPLLQSRGCTKEIAVGQAVVETLAKRFYVSGAVQGVGFRFFAEQVSGAVGRRRIREKSFRWTRGSICHRQRGPT